MSVVVAGAGGMVPNIYTSGGHAHPNVAARLLEAEPRTIPAAAAPSLVRAGQEATSRLCGRTTKVRAIHAWAPAGATDTVSVCRIVNTVCTVSEQAVQEGRLSAALTCRDRCSRCGEYGVNRCRHGEPSANSAVRTPALPGWRPGRTFPCYRDRPPALEAMPCGRKRKRHKIATHKRKKRLRKSRHKKKNR
jgi:hypothetical protein